MNRLRVAASSRDAALRVQQRALQEALIAPNSAAEERAAEKLRDVRATTPATMRWPRSTPAATAPTPMPASI